MSEFLSIVILTLMPSHLSRFINTCCPIVMISPALPAFIGGAPALIGSAKIPVDPSADVPDIDGDNWVELFNKENLDAWVQRNGTASFRVDNGEIVGETADGSPNSFLCTKKEYGDFELTFLFKGDAELNSGVQIRSSSKSDFNNGRVNGLQIEIEKSPGESGYLYSEGTGRGWISKRRPIKDAMRNDDWNRFVIRAQGDRVQTWLNGSAIADIRDPDSPRRGFIGLQVHEIPRGSGPYKARWRDMRIRPL